MNFASDERPFAMNMLNVFLYYNDPIIDALFYGTVHQLSSIVTGSVETFHEAKSRWSAFLATLLVTIVEGDPPNLTDSGHIFARRSRTVLGIPQNRILPPKEALNLVLSEPNYNILMVDDFIGSGKQLVDTWHRKYIVTNGRSESFCDAALNERNVFYAPIIGTQYGIEQIKQQCPKLKIIPAHILDESYSLVSPSSMLWPDSLKPHAHDFLKTVSQRAGINDALDDHWAGFHGLALAIAFEHGVPDATMPIYWWNQNGWKPLITRR